jgi:Zn-dependent protease with chaperone function
MSARIAAWLRTLSPLALSAGAVALVAILWRGGWPSDTAPQRIDWLGWTLIGVIIWLGLSLFLVGGIRNARVRAGPAEASINNPDTSETETEAQ